MALFITLQTLAPLQAVRDLGGELGVNPASMVDPDWRVPEHLRLAVAAARAAGREYVRLLVLDDGDRGVRSLVEDLNGQVLWQDERSGVGGVIMPVGKVFQLVQRAPKAVLAADRKVGLGAFPVSHPEAEQVRATAQLPDMETAVGSGTKPDLSINRALVGAEALEMETGADGKGITIAIIDTGIDPGHPDLTLTNHGEAKIVDWKDFTGSGPIEQRAREAAGTVPAEGDVATRFLASIRGNRVLTSRGELDVTGIKSVSGILHYGFFQETQLDETSPLDRDINHNGWVGDQYLVLVADSRQRGVYDTVYIDMDGDNNLAEEKPMAAFAAQPGFRWFGRDDPSTAVEDRTAFTVTEISSDGNLVNLGFDGNGHGTHVAGIAAGFRPGGLRGIAPGARLMSLKALGSSGDGTWTSISEAMLYAARNGADIISVSVGGLTDISSGGSDESRLVTTLSRQYNVLVLLAAGNNGPGIGTGHTPGDPEESLTIGAYAAPELWRQHYGFEIAREGLWYFSAVGPRNDGSISPNLVAPGSAASTVPGWSAPGGYQLFEGTSMAVPHVAGGAALLLEAARGEGIVLSRGAIKRALELGARSLPDYLPLEQGYGVINLQASWRLLGRLQQPLLPLAVTFTGPDDTRVAGLYARGWIPGRAQAVFENQGRIPNRVELEMTASFAQPDRPRLFLPAGGSRGIAVDYRVQTVPGVYTGFLTVRPGGMSAARKDLLQTVVVPYDLPPQAGTLSLDGNAAPGTWRRFFFRVSPGTAVLSLQLAVPPDSAGRPQGRVRMHVYRPDGRELLISDYVGGNPGGGSREVLRTIESPESGVWEVDVYSSASLSQYGIGQSRFRLSVQAGGVRFDPEGWEISLPEDATGTVTRSVMVKTSGASVVGMVSALGLAGEPAGFTGKSTSLAVGEPAYEEINVPSGAAILQVRAANPSHETAKLELYLFRFDEASDQLVEVGRAGGVQSNAVVTLASPPPGRYIAWVEGYNFAGVRLRFELTSNVYRDAGMITTDDSMAEHLPGESWPVKVTVKVPPRPGTYHGYLVFRNAEGEILVSQPFLVRKGEPELHLELDSEGLVEGREANLVLRTTQGEGRVPVDLDIEIDGRLYRTQEGLLQIPVTPVGPQLNLNVRARIAADYWRIYKYVLPVLPRDMRSGLPPAGGEDSIFRQKLLWQLGR